MKILSNSEQMCIAAGMTSISNEGIKVTGTSKMTLNGLVFSSDGNIYNAYTKEIIHDFVNDTNSYCFQGNLFTASPVQDGFLYKTGNC